MRLLTAVVSAKESGRQRHYWGEQGAWSLSPPGVADTMSSMVWRSVSTGDRLPDDDAVSDTAVEDQTIDVPAELHTLAASCPVILPWRGPSRLATVVESDEEDEAAAADEAMRGCISGAGSPGSRSF